MPQEMLRKVDRMTMAYSVEGRVPFATPAVLSHAAKLSYANMVKGNVLKWSLRQAFSDILPVEITERPKHGFNVPRKTITYEVCVWSQQWHYSRGRVCLSC